MINVLVSVFLSSAIAKDIKITKSCYMKPCILKLDLDWDGRQDKAELVENADGKKGVRITLASKKEFVVGAGNQVGRSDDFSGFNVFKEFKGRIVKTPDSEDPPKLKGSALLVGVEDSGSGIIYWTGYNFEWHQAGD